MQELWFLRFAFRLMLIDIKVGKKPVNMSTDRAGG